MDFERVLRTLSDFFRESGAPWGVIGGLAMTVHGAARTTLDVDIVVDGGIQDRLIEHLESRGYETIHRSTGYSNHLHADANLGRIDVVYVRGDTSRQIIAAMEDHLGPGGVAIKVPRAAHLAAMKTYSIKNDPDRTLRELADIRILLDAPGVDRGEIDRYFVRYGLEHLLERLDEG